MPTTLERILKVAVAPTLVGWAASWIAPFTGTLFAFQKWATPVGDTIAPICGVLVLVVVGFAWAKSDRTLRSLAIYSTCCFAVSAVVCLILRVVVEHLTKQGTIVTVRDYIWPTSFGITLVLMIATVTLWAIYVARHVAHSET